MLDCAPARTPLPTGLTLEKATQEATPEFHLKYQSLIGSLLYAMLGTRPDISYAITRLSRFNSNPSVSHWKAAKYILRYLKATKDFRLRFDGSTGSGLIGYSDADWAENKDDRHSTTGYCFLMAGGAVSWVTRRQPTVALSSTEAEYMALSDTSRQTAWFRTLLSELGFDLTSQPTPLCADNQGAIFMSVNPVHDRRTKHVDIRYHFIREFIENKNAELYHVATEEMIADTLTKSLAHSSGSVEAV
ncbi:hypothetical protein JAAARDRAFT_190047 [Jaapia argillacea MUCL 33604]|uniref:Reverse transcriptase Ty1/copia-type domain-containing protein n=1 Tax=Jaapia argillacea MUCL 33604 TaxID=933084 RepID=A0A067QGW8_9AGAM|nr:hypothetical protein JAAARDRAFT_190047 [Jaapia argillacea MUCL 33604]